MILSDITEANAAKAADRGVKSALKWSQDKYRALAEATYRDIEDNGGYELWHSARCPLCSLFAKNDSPCPVDGNLCTGATCCSEWEEVNMAYDEGTRTRFHKACAAMAQLLDTRLKEWKKNP